MRAITAGHRSRWFLPRIDRHRLVHAGILLAALVLGILVGEVGINPNRRLIVFLVGLAFTSAIYAVPSVLSLAVLTFLLPFGVKIIIGNTNMIFILLVALVYLLRQVRDPERLDTRSRVWVPLLLLLGVHVASLYNVAAEDFTQSLVKVFGLASAMLLCYLVVAVVRDVPTLKLITFVSVTACALTLILAVWEIAHPGHTILPKFFYAPWSSRKSGVRPVGTFGNYSNYAQYLAMNVVILGFLFQRARSGLTRTMLLAMLTAVGGIFLTTGMRGAFVALVVGGIYILTFGRHAVRVSEFAGLAVILAGVMAGASMLLVQVVHTGTIFTRYATFGATGGSGEARMEIAEHLLGRVPDHLFIGHGPLINLQYSRVLLPTNNPHDQYLYYLYTVGIVGLVAFLWFVGRLAYEGHRTLVTTRRADPFALGLLAVLQGNLVLFLFHEMFDDYMFSPLSMQVTWFYFGLLLATVRLVRQTASGRTAAGLPS